MTGPTIPARDVFAAMRQLPITPVSTLTQHGPLFILAPHPDDESLGCGGLIAACCEAGTPPFVLILTDGAGSHPNSRDYPPARLVELREQEAREAVTCLGLPPDRIGFLRLPDTQAPTSGPAFTNAIGSIAHLATKHRTGPILSPWQHDPHCDHVAAHLMAASLSRDLGYLHLAYPIWGLTLPPDTPMPSPAPTGWRTDITAHLAVKRQAIAAHRSQYTGLITDDPQGFQLPPDFLAMFDGPYETILQVDQPIRP